MRATTAGVIITISVLVARRTMPGAHRGSPGATWRDASRQVPHFAEARPPAHPRAARRVASRTWGRSVTARPSGAVPRPAAGALLAAVAQRAGAPPPDAV